MAFTSNYSKYILLLNAISKKEEDVEYIEDSKPFEIIVKNLIKKNPKLFFF